MFTVKVVNQDEGNTLLFSWPSVRVHGTFSTEFELMKDAEYEEANDELKPHVDSYYAWIGDNDGNEYWLAIGDDCFITDASGKTVQAIRSPQVIHEMR